MSFLRDTRQSDGLTSKSNQDGGAFANLGHSTFRGEAMYNVNNKGAVTLLQQEGHAETLGALPGIDED